MNINMQGLYIVGKYAFNGFTGHAQWFCVPGGASDLASLLNDAESARRGWAEIVPLGSSIWRYELASLISNESKDSLTEGN